MLYVTVPLTLQNSEESFSNSTEAVDEVHLGTQILNNKSRINSLRENFILIYVFFFTRHTYISVRESVIL